MSVFKKKKTKLFQKLNFEKRKNCEIKGTITILMRMSKVAVSGGESYMCSSGFLQKYFIPSAKYQTATGILKRQKMLNKSYFSKAKKKISKNKLGVHF